MLHGYVMRARGNQLTTETRVQSLGTVLEIIVKIALHAYIAELRSRLLLQCFSRAGEELHISRQIRRLRFSIEAL